MSTQTQPWHDPAVAQRYANAEKATAPFARFLVSKADWSGDVSAFDLATGTGAAVKEIYDAIPKERWGEVKVLGADMSEGMLEYLKARGEREGWRGLEVGVVDGNDMSNVKKDEYTHVLCTFGIFIMKDALPSLYNIAQKGGFVGVSTWKWMSWMPLLHHTISTLPLSPRPYAPTPSEIINALSSNTPWSSPSYLSSQLSAAGFTNVSTHVEKISIRAGTPETVMQSLDFPLRMVIAQFWPEDKREEYLRVVGEAVRAVVEGLKGGDGEVEMEFEGVCGWGWKGE